MKNISPGSWILGMPFLIWLLLSLPGCEPDSKTGDLSITEAQRRSVDPKAVRFLIGAQDAFQEKAYSGALMLTDSAKQYAPLLPDIYFLRGLIFTELRNYRDAEAAYQQVLSIDPNYQGVYINLGTTAFRQGDTRRALEYFRKEYALHSSAQALQHIGRAYAKEGKMDSALQIYNKALSLDSTYAVSYFRIAELYKEEGDLGKALQYARQGLTLDPDNINYRHFIGSLLLLAGYAEEAAEHLKIVVEKRPWHYWGNYNLGQALIRLGNREEGERYIAKAEELQKELKNIQEWKQLAENNPDQLMLWVNLGEAYRRAGRNEEAIEAFNVALNLEPRFIALQNNLANLYMVSGDTAMAIYQYQDILKRYPTVVDVWLNLGAVYANNGNIEKARETWEAGLKFVPDNPELKSNLAKLKEME